MSQSLNGGHFHVYIKSPLYHLWLSRVVDKLSGDLLLLIIYVFHLELLLGKAAIFEVDQRILEFRLCVSLLQNLTFRGKINYS